jgi:hypothetical protein
VLVYIYNDHVTAFFDHYSHFALAVGESYGPTDEGGGPRDITALCARHSRCSYSVLIVAGLKRFH